mgnify:CR=1 FL=1
MTDDLAFLLMTRRGYRTVGNEFDYFMLLVSNFMLNVVEKPCEFEIAPWLEDKNNIMSRRHQLETYSVPDVPTLTILAKNPGHYMSMVSDSFILRKWFLDVLTEVCGDDSPQAQGEWIDIVGNSPNAWDVFVTCFFLDTAPNVIEYIETIWRILKPGGVWVRTTMTCDAP